MQQLPMSAYLLLLVLLCLTTARCSGDLQHGTWDVSTLVPGRGAVPPGYELTVQPGKWTVRERESGPLGRLLDYAAARFGLVYAGVPSDDLTLCHMPSSLSLKLEAARTDEGIQFECQTVWFSPSTLHSLEKDKFLHHRFDPAEQLYSADNGRCLATPWRVQELYVAKMIEGTYLLTGVLVSGASDAQGSCNVYLEVRHRPVALASDSSSSSTLVSISTLLVVVAVRLLPRYILTRKGQLEKTSYRGKNSGNLTPAQRLHLLRQQKEIIEKMKAEDSANMDKRTAA
ncbi:hypothetical protein, conserved [Leishmania tarentolae]|uniref:Uncharacterized protein n=1 Tax=Leishmania tarentolae TaxID=5689 RepID=A0A640KTZ2_LEITA|nr:hypothetical protein, conserved [Leishmania tarentolae]